MTRIRQVMITSISIILLGSTSIYSQTSSLQYLAEKESVSSIESFYYTKIGQQSQLFNGKEYQFYNSSIEGVAYFHEDNLFQKGSIKYDGFTYDSIPLMYDMNKDLLIGLLYDGFSKYSFVSEKVSDFYLYDHHFISISIDTSAVDAPFHNGFFDLVYDGKSQIIVKRIKELKETSGTRDLKKYFLTKTLYYIKKDGRYYSITNERAFMNVFKDRKKELQQYLKSNQLKFSKEPERIMMLLAGYYDLLSN